MVCVICEVGHPQLLKHGLQPPVVISEETICSFSKIMGSVKVGNIVRELEIWVNPLPNLDELWWDLTGLTPYSVVLLVFSVVKYSSLYYILTEALRQVSIFPAVPVVLVGTDTDKRNLGGESISAELGAKIAEKINACSYVECSSLKEGTWEVFYAAVQASVTIKLPSLNPYTPISTLLKHACSMDNIPQVCEIIDQWINLTAEVGEELLQYAVSSGFFNVARLLVLSGAKWLGLPDSLSTLQEHILQQNKQRPRITYALENQSITHVTRVLWTAMRKFDVINLYNNQLGHIEVPEGIKMHTRKLILRRNLFSEFPLDLHMVTLKKLDISFNNLTSLPEGITSKFPNLKTLNVMYNKLESLPADLATLKHLHAAGNPLSEILPAYRHENEKIEYYLRMMHQQATQPWNQVKLVLVGQEGVGKTTLLRSLQDHKFNCATNISTNGVDITKLSLCRSTSFLCMFGHKEPSVEYRVWDFSGQAVFHSTHRFFITSNALYVILYDMRNLESIQRVKYWIEQVRATNDFSGNRPILIVGTHSDMLSAAEHAKIFDKVRQEFPLSTSGRCRTVILGHFTLGLTAGEKDGLGDLREKLIDIGLNHPKIGIGKVQVPKSFSMMQKELEERKLRTPYVKWTKYADIGSSMGIPEDELQSITTMLHDTGYVVWHNVPKLCNIVVINPQWLADAMAGVVTFMSQSTNYGGTMNWGQLREIIQLKFQNYDVQRAILSLLEFFEIIYKLRTNLGFSRTLLQELHDEQMFYIPSLLLPSDSASHPTMQYWKKITPVREFTRRFSWPFYPTGFFPRLLLRLVHLPLRPLACWLDVAIIMGNDGVECARLHLSRGKDLYTLEVVVKSDATNQKEDSLIVELSYVISRLHRDMYVNSLTEIPFIHEVIANVPDKMGELQLVELPFEDCINAQISNKSYINVRDLYVRLEDITPDICRCPVIPNSRLTTGKHIAKGGFGDVYVGQLQSDDYTVPVVLKQLQIRHANDAIYEFQHEVSIMNKLDHENVVKLYGITQHPLQMILEFVPYSDLLHVLKLRNKNLSLKWKLKIAIDIATGMRYLHGQCPPICHSDLRAPNIFVVSLDEKAPVIGKIGDFGLSQQIFPYGQQQLLCVTETAPETWGEVRYYDEKSDIFSFAVILWRLFGALSIYKTESTPHEPGKDDYAFVMKNGKLLHEAQQRKIILEGGRLEIHEKCPERITALIKECWLTLPDLRPPFSVILDRLIEYYIENYSEDEYIGKKRKENSINYRWVNSRKEQNQIRLDEFSSDCFSALQWNAVSFSHEPVTVTSLVEMGSDVWIGTSCGQLLLANETRQINPIAKVIPSNSSSPTCEYRIKAIAVAQHFLWVAVESEIHIFFAKAHQEITAPLLNLHTIVSMVYIPGPMLVWVSDSSGFISIWDAQTLQKCYRFQIHESNCAQAMALLDNSVWMAVGKDIISVNINTFEKTEPIKAHHDRIHQIIAVPHVNQVWTCARDRDIKIWQLDQTTDKKGQIKMIKEWKTRTPVKSAVVMVDGVHVCTGAFDGSVAMWNIHNFQCTEIPTPTTTRNHSVQCILDTSKDLWCGLECSAEPLQCHLHIAKDMLIDSFVLDSFELNRSSSMQWQ